MYITFRRTMNITEGSWDNSVGIVTVYELDSKKSEFGSWHGIQTSSAAYPVLWSLPLGGKTVRV
jgi:hypothetical protein